MLLTNMRKHSTLNEFNVVEYHIWSLDTYTICKIYFNGHLLWNRSLHSILGPMSMYDDMEREDKKLE